MTNEKFFDKYFFEITVIGCIVLCFFIWFGLMFLAVLPSPIVFSKECLSFHYDYIEHVNSFITNNYKTLTKICDVQQIYAKNNQMNKTLVGYDYSYDYQQNYSKSFRWVLPSCDEEFYDRKIQYNDTVKGFICSDGHLAKEFPTL